MGVIKIKLNKGELKLNFGSKYIVEAKVDPRVLGTINSIFQQYENYGKLFISLNYESFDKEKAIMFTREMINKIKENDENSMTLSLFYNLPPNTILGEEELNIIKKACRCIIKITADIDVSEIKLNNNSIEININNKLWINLDNKIEEIFEIDKKLETFLKCIQS